MGVVGRNDKFLMHLAVLHYDVKVWLPIALLPSQEVARGEMLKQLGQSRAARAI